MGRRPGDSAQTCQLPDGRILRIRANDGFRYEFHFRGETTFLLWILEAAALPANCFPLLRFSDYLKQK